MQKKQSGSTDTNTQHQNAKKYAPTIGMINNIKTLDCHISLSPEQPTHKFTVNYKPLNIFQILLKRRIILAFQKIASMTFQLKVKQSNVFIPQALLNGDTNVIHQYKKILQKGRIQSYIKLNIRKQQVSREKKARPVSLKENNSRVSLQQLYNKKMTIADKNSFNNHINTNSIITKINKDTIISDNLQIQQPTVRKLTNSRKQKQYQQKQISNPLFKSNIFKPYVTQKNNQNYLTIPGQFRQQIHHHHSFYHHKKTKKSSLSVVNKSQKNNPFQGIKINYYQVKSNCKQNPQMATFIYPHMGIASNKSGPKSVRDNNNNKSIRQHSTIKTEIRDLQNKQKTKTYQSPSQKHLQTVQNNIKGSPLKNEVQMDKFSIRSHLVNQPQFIDSKIKINNSLYMDGGFENKGQNIKNYFLGEQINGGKTLIVGHQRNIVKRKAKITPNKNNEWMGGFEMNMV